MKKLLLLLLFSIAAIGWRSEDLLQKIGTLNLNTVTFPESFSIQSLIAPADQSLAVPDDQLLAVSAVAKPKAGISLTEYAELSKTDPDAYYKLLQSYQQEEDRTEVDKLLNFFAHFKYE